MAFVRRKAPFDDEIPGLERSKKTKLGNSSQDKEPTSQDSSSSSSSSISKVRTECEKILQEIGKQLADDGHILASIFEELPSAEEYPTYYTVIKEPIALENIRENIKNNEYKTIEQFKEDCDTMFTNAKRFNEPGSMVYNDAAYLQKFVAQKVAELFPEKQKTRRASTSKLKSDLNDKIGSPTEMTPSSRRGSSSARRTSSSKSDNLNKLEEESTSASATSTEANASTSNTPKSSPRIKRGGSISNQEPQESKSKHSPRLKRSASLTEEPRVNSSQRSPVKRTITPTQSPKPKRASIMRKSSSGEEALIKQENDIDERMITSPKSTPTRQSSRSKRNSTAQQSAVASEEEFEEASSSSSKPRRNSRNRNSDYHNYTEEDVSELFRTISNNDFEGIQQFFSTHPNFDVNKLWQSGKQEFTDDDFTWAPLHCAAYHGNKNIIRFLVKHGADVEIQDTWYAATPLAWAAFGGDFEATRFLVEEYGADIKAQNVHGQVPYEIVPSPDPHWQSVLLEASEIEPPDKNSMIPDRNDRQSRPSTPIRQIAQNRPSTPEPRPARSSSSQRTPSYSMKHPAHKSVSITKQKNSQASQLMKDLWQLIVDHRDSSGRQYSELFMDLPSKTEYPQYYKAIENPISLNIIERKIRKGYTSVQDFDRDFQLIFENAMYFNEDGSRIFKDAKLLQKLYNNNKKDLFKACAVETPSTPGTSIYYKSSATPTSRISTPELRKPTLTLSYQSVTYGIGDFVYIRDPNSSNYNIIVIERLFMNAKSQKRFAGSVFYRPDQTEHPSSMKFFEKEVFKTSVIEEHMLMDIVGKCFVMHSRDYILAHPEGFDDNDVYVCESSYAVASKFFTPIGDWASTLSVHIVIPVNLIPLETPRMLARNYEAESAVSAYTQNVHTPLELDEGTNTYKIRMPPPPPLPSNSSGNTMLPMRGEIIHPISTSTPEPMNFGSPHPLNGNQLHVKESTNVELHSNSSPQSQVRSTDQITTKTTNVYSLNQTAEDNNVIPRSHSSPEMLLQNDESNNENQKTQLIEEAYGVEAATGSAMSLDANPEMNIDSIEHVSKRPTNNNSTESYAQSPQNQEHVPPAEDNHRLFEIPMLLESNSASIHTTRVYDESTLDARQNPLLLQGIGVEASDRSFAMSLDTKHNAHSITLGPNATHVTIIPILVSSLLLPVPKPVDVFVYHQGRKVINTGHTFYPNAPSITHQNFIISLVPGVNNIDIWVYVPSVIATTSTTSTSGSSAVNGTASSSNGQTDRYSIFIAKQIE
ncbi:12160_t:CDS:10 [Ambispora gerdemannii]|uniref:12160_t:CDS:1 n=1 Tax=Ambispora gerdemannii TaxID=144530 RepID=A0A9N8ZBR7_9GLOM|nr:12160_t:CDS:10 [Ambispora gerdemannii]